MKININNNISKTRYKYIMDTYYISGNYENNMIDLVGNRRDVYDKDGNRTSSEKLYIPDPDTVNFRKSIENIKELIDDYQFRDVTRLYQYASSFQYFPRWKKESGVTKVEKKPEDIKFDYNQIYIELVDGGKEEYINMIHDIFITDNPKYTKTVEYIRFMDTLDRKIKNIKSDDKTNIYFMNVYINWKYHVFSISYDYAIQERHRPCHLGDIAVYFGNEVYVAQYAARPKLSIAIDDRIYFISGKDTVHNDEFEHPDIDRTYDVKGPIDKITFSDIDSIFFPKYIQVRNRYATIQPENANYDITVEDDYNICVVGHNKEFIADTKLINSIHDYMKEFSVNPKNDMNMHRITIYYDSKDYGKGHVNIAICSGRIVKIEFPVSFWKNHITNIANITIHHDNNIDFDFHIWNDDFDIREDCIKIADSVMNQERVAEIKTAMKSFIEELDKRISFYTDDVLNCAFVNYLVSYFPNSSVKDINSILSNPFVKINFNYAVRLVAQYSIIGTFM